MKKIVIVFFLLLLFACEKPELDGHSPIQSMNLEQSGYLQAKLDESFKLHLLIEPQDFQMEDWQWSLLPEGVGVLKKATRTPGGLKLQLEFYEEGIHLLRIETKQNSLLLEQEIEVHPKWRDKCPILLQEIREKEKVGGQE